MDRSQTRQALAIILDQEIQISSKLQVALSREQEALGSNDPDAINATGTEKREQVELLESLEHERNDLCFGCGYSAEPVGVEALVAWCDKDDELKSRWNALLNLIKKCHATNETNGLVVEMQRRRVQLALRLLHGRSDEPGVYGPAGEATASDAGRSIATA